MTPTPQRVVFDCNVYFQAFISEQGPAGRLLRAVVDYRAALYASDFVLAELRDVLARPHIVAKFKFTDQRVEEYLEMLADIAVMVADVPHVFEFPRDPKDAPYVDLAIAVDAKLIVSRDKDLLSLRDLATAEGRDFASRFPTIAILTPSEALHAMTPPVPPTV